MERSNVVVLLRAEYDISTVPALEQELDALGPGDGIIDFANVEYMDTTALRSLVKIRKTGDYASVRLRNLRPAMRRTLEVTGLGQIFTLE